MDHLPLPTNPTIGNALKIPLLTSTRYDNLSFPLYPRRHGWEDGKQGFLGKCYTRHGRRVSGREFAAFLQTWLFFGLLSAFTGWDGGIGEFEGTDEGGEPGRWLRTARSNHIVGEWTRRVVGQEWAGDLRGLAPWRDRLARYLLIARDVALRAKKDPEGAPGGGVGLTCVAVAALAELLDQAVRDVFAWKGLGAHAQVDQQWRRVGEYDCGDVLVPFMRRAGWCESEIARLDGHRCLSVSALWVFANMAAPRGGRDHGGCSRERCRFGYVSGDGYRVAHTEGSCRCCLLWSDHATLAAVIERQQLPLLQLRKGQSGCTEEAELTAVPHQQGTDFIAVSHIWSDGHGNPLENALPACFLNRLTGLIAELPGCTPLTPFWIDTLCVPRSPPELLNAALLRLRDSFEKACGVLVLDSHLQSFRIDSISVLEVFARIEACGWMQRLWTFQEGRISRRLWFQFQDGAIDLVQLVEKWLGKVPRIPSVAPSMVARQLFLNHTASNVLELPEFEELQNRFFYFRYSLRRRSTSVAEDEPLCLANLMGLDVSKILASPGPDRMEVFWSMVPDIPSSLVFSDASRKMDRKGKRWAPTSLLGDVDARHWGGPQSLFDVEGHDNPRAKASENGLGVNLPGMKFEIPSHLQHLVTAQRLPSDALKSPPSQEVSEELDHALTLTDNKGAWFTCFVEGDWHQVSSLEPEGTEQVSLVMARREGSRQEGINYEFRPTWTVRGVLTTHKTSEPEPGPLLVKAHKHVQVHREGARHEEVYNRIMEPVTKLYDECSELQQNDRAERVDGQAMLRQFLEDDAILQQLLRERRKAYGLMDSDEMVWGDYWQVTRRLVKCWPVCSVRVFDENTEWCVD